MFPSPTVIAMTDDERRALTTVAALFHRSGTALATHLLTRQPSTGDAVLLMELRDQLLAASLLCRGIGDPDA